MRPANSLLIVLGSLAATVGAGCSQHAPPVLKDLRSERLAALEAIGRKCGYPRSGWYLVGNDELRLTPNPNERYEVVDCMLVQTRKSGAPFKMGFIGNEAPASGNGQ
jgi:hypothetical protein